MAEEPRKLRIALAQVNTTVGDIEGNARLLREWIARGRDAGAQLVVFPEQTVTGYPAEDLWLKPHFLEAARRALEEIASEVSGVVAVVGFPEREAAIYNSAAVLAEGAIRAVYRKTLLPNYSVFDERRYFEPGDTPALVEVAGVRVGLTICEDIWYPGAPASVEALSGASLIVNPSASPYHRGKGIARERMVAERARETGAAFALCNAVGGQDELVFDGHSVVVSPGGETLARGPQFREDLVLCDLELEPRAGAGPAASVPAIATLPARAPTGSVEPTLAEPLEPVAEIYEALRLGLADYVAKNGFERVLVAISGGIDSSLVALIAVDALGADRVTCVVMPSPHGAQGTREDATQLARNLGIQLIELPITDPMRGYDELLSDVFAGREPDITEENLQARIRGNLLMALSNKFGWLVLTTGNKSEMS